VLLARGGEDEMMRVIFSSEMKRWEARQSLEAARLRPCLPDDDDDDDDGEAEEDSVERKWAEEVMALEEAEVEALIDAHLRDTDQEMGEACGSSIEKSERCGNCGSAESLVEMDGDGRVCFVCGAAAAAGVA